MTTARSSDSPARSKSAKRNEKQRWPFIKRRIYPNGSVAWMVDARTVTGGERKTFGTRNEAETFAEQCRTRRENEGVTAFGNEELARYGKSVQDAITFYLEYLRRQERSVPLQFAIDEMINSRRASGRSEEYCSGLQLRLRKFENSFSKRSAASVTPKEIDAWLVGLTCAPATRNTFRRDVQTLFSFCLKRGYTTENPASGTEIAKDVEKPVEILTVAEAARVLECCTDDVLPYAAIAMFAGLRSAEVKKLDWSEVGLDGGFIEVKAHKAKTARRRLVKLSDNLKKWLDPFVKTAGPVVPINFRRRWNAVLQKAGYQTRNTGATEDKKLGGKLKPWPKNALRHSYGSYWLAKYQNVAECALQMGNSPSIIFTHYRELVRPKEAERFWELIPLAPTSQTIIEITAA